MQQHFSPAHPPLQKPSRSAGSGFTSPPRARLLPCQDQRCLDWVQRPHQRRWWWWWCSRTEPAPGWHSFTSLQQTGRVRRAPGWGTGTPPSSGCWVPPDPPPWPGLGKAPGSLQVRSLSCIRGGGGLGGLARSQASLHVSRQGGGGGSGCPLPPSPWPLGAGR